MRVNWGLDARLNNLNFDCGLEHLYLLEVLNDLVSLVDLLLDKDVSLPLLFSLLLELSLDLGLDLVLPVDLLLILLTHVLFVFLLLYLDLFLLFLISFEDVVQETHPIKNVRHELMR